MKKIICIFFFFCALITTSANEIIISFKTKVNTVAIDSIHVANLTKGQTVKLKSGESLLIASATSSELIKINDIREGYLYPNPTNGNATLSFSTAQNEKVYISIYDMSGKMLLSKTQSLIQGNHRFQLHFPTPGLYHVTVLTNGGTLTYKAVYLGSDQQLNWIEYLGSNQLITENSQVKSTSTEKTLDYSEGDVVHYTVFSGDNITVISDTPTATKTIEVEFYECKDADGNYYPIVKIGNQWWMAENLKTKKYNDGTPLPLVTDKYAWLYLETPGYCWSNNNESAYKDAYGALYNWYAVNTGKLCALGWHVPNNDEWEVLNNYLGGWLISGTKLKEAGTIHWESPNSNATNESGFTGLPGGMRYSDGDFYPVGKSAGSWWSSSEYTSTDAFIRALQLQSPYFYGGYRSIGGYEDKHYGLSIRCIKDN